MAKAQPRRPVRSAGPARTAAQAAAPESTAGFAAPAFFTRIGLQTGLIFAFAFLLYANTMRHGFVLDDAIVITENVHTQKGIEGIPGILTTDAFTAFFQAEGKKTLVAGGRYRPFTLVIFAVVYEFAGKNPFAFHLLTVLLFAATCAVFYRTLGRLMLVRFGEGYAAMLAWVAALLFAAHPIHTEVVANIKGCDEIVTLLLSLGALWLVLKTADTGRQHWLAGAAAVFFLACLSKENAVTFLAVIPLALWFFRPAAGAGKIVAWSWPLLAAFLAFFLIRTKIIGLSMSSDNADLMNDPFQKFAGGNWVPYDAGERLATIFYTLGKYVWLLLFPHPLTHDYYPLQIPMQTFGNPAVLLSLLLYAGLAVYALRGIGQKDPVRFGILFYLLTLSIVSNVVFPIGTNMGERFLFMPSAGFCIAAAALLLRIGRSDKGMQWNTALGIAGVLALFFSVKTLLRNPAWASNEKLFFTDLPTSPNSAKIHNACGGALFEKAVAEKDPITREQTFRESFAHADKAVQLYNRYKDALVTRAGCRFHLQDYDGAIADYRRAAELANNDPKILGYLAIALRQGGQHYGDKKDFVTAAKLLNESWRLNNQDPGTARQLGVLAAIDKKPAESLEWFKKAAELAPDNASILFDLGTAYYFMGDIARQQEYHQRAIQLDPSLKARMPQ